METVGNILDDAWDVISAPVKLIVDAADLIVDALPYIKTALSLMPGIGTGVAALIGATEALAAGRPITSAFVDAVQDAMPGGPVARLAFRTAYKMAKGARIDEAALDAVKGELPEGPRRALELATELAKGKPLKGAVLRQVKRQLPAAMRDGLRVAVKASKAFDAGVAVARAQRLQRAKAREVIRAKRTLGRLAKGRKIPHGLNVPVAQRYGFRVAMGVLKSKTITPVQAMTIRALFKTRNGQLGWDAAMRRAADNARVRRAGRPTARPGRGEPHSITLRCWTLP